jgi:rRNA-processing protein EBP2
MERTISFYDGVDEEGMARLMELLGDDGLDELGQAQLAAFAAEDEDDHDDSSKEGDVEGDYAATSRAVRSLL